MQLNIIIETSLNEKKIETVDSKHRLYDAKFVKLSEKQSSLYLFLLQAFHFITMKTLGWNWFDINYVCLT